MSSRQAVLGVENASFFYGANRVFEGVSFQLDAARTEVLVAPGSQAVLTLSNNDPLTHQFQWQVLDSAGVLRPSAAPVVRMPANGSITLDVSAAVRDDATGPIGGLLRFVNSGTLRDDVSGAELLLTPELGAANGVPPQPVKRLAFRIRSQFWRAPVQQAWAFLVTFVLLALGGLGSLFYRSFIPNALEASRLNGMLDDEHQKLNGTGTALASKWRVLLMCSLNNCRKCLEEGSSFLPNHAATLREVRQSLEIISAWIEVAYSASLVRQQVENVAQMGIPPSLLALIEERCEEALQPIATGFTKPEEVQAMVTGVNWASTTLDAFTEGKPIPELEAIIQERETRLGPALPELKTTNFPEFAALFTQLEGLKARTLTPALYMDRDTFSLKAELLLEYRDLTLRAGAPAFPPAMTAAAAAGGGTAAAIAPPALVRILSRDPLFREYVRPDSYESLCVAKLLIAEMRQDFYPAALIAETAKTPPAVQIVTEPAAVKAGVRLRLALRFDRHALNEIAALREWTCCWDFGDSTAVESGWEVFHLFSNPGETKVTVTITQLDGQKVCVLERMLQVAGGQPAGFASRWINLCQANKLEAGRLTFALALALLGL
ncbi:MAG: hypothetical protein K2Q23_14165, partial [Bryobacteraceae bacterium]|nr:hypothetical protein [Bryobacteraceae bacterium]